MYLCQRTFQACTNLVVNLLPRSACVAKKKKKDINAIVHLWLKKFTHVLFRFVNYVISMCSADSTNRRGYHRRICARGRYDSKIVMGCMILGEMLII